MGGGDSGGSTSTSTPLTGAQRAELYNYGMASIGGSIPQLQNVAQYQTPNYVGANIYDPGAGVSSVVDPGAGQNVMYDPGTGYNTMYDAGAAERMGGGDYGRLEQSIIQSRMAPLEAAYATQTSKLDSDLAKRGIYSSGAAVQAQNDLTSSFLPQITQAGADAAAQRYALQQADIAAANQYNLSRTGQLQSGAEAANQYNLSRTGQLSSAGQAQNQYDLARAAQLSSGLQADNTYAMNRANQLTSAQQANAAAANAFNLENANRVYNSAWQPYNYGAGLWNGTSGAISNSSSGGGWSFMI